VRAFVGDATIRARCVPSTSTFTVPSGSFSICRIDAIEPTSYRSVADGSSSAALFCATSRMCLPASIATSSALIDFGRPTNSGNHHVREDHDVAQRQQREGGQGTGLDGHGCLVA
jgi:hypothetical protein